jgi:integrase
VIQQQVLKPAGEKIGLPGIGWHTFRHTYRSLLDETGGSDRCAAEAHAAQQRGHHHEHLRQRELESQTGSKLKRCANGNGTAKSTSGSAAARGDLI